MMMKFLSSDFVFLSLYSVTLVLIGFVAGAWSQYWNMKMEAKLPIMPLQSQVHPAPIKQETKIISPYAPKKRSAKDRGAPRPSLALGSSANLPRSAANAQRLGSDQRPAPNRGAATSWKKDADNSPSEQERLDHELARLASSSLPNIEWGS